MEVYVGLPTVSYTTTSSKLYSLYGYMSNRSVYWVAYSVKHHNLNKKPFFLNISNVLIVTQLLSLKTTPNQPCSSKIINNNSILNRF